MKRVLFPIIALLGLLLPALPSRAENALPGQWRIFNTFDDTFEYTIDTPTRVYLVARGQLYRANATGWGTVEGQLFVLDKASGEVQPYNSANYLTGNIVKKIAYNSVKKYLMIIYSDYRIDLLYDADDSLYTIPALASSTLSTSKEVRNVSFDAKNNKAYLATDFGYIVLDDKRNVISESHIFNTPVNAALRVGDNVVLGTDDALYTAPASKRVSSLADFTKVADFPAAGVKFGMPLTESTFAVLANPRVFYKGSFDKEGNLTFGQILDDNADTFMENRDGYFLRRSNCAISLDRDGKVSRYYNMPNEGMTGLFCSWDMKTYWVPVVRKGLQAHTWADNAWTSAPVVPINAPRCYGVRDFAFTANHGTVTANETFNRIYFADWIQSPLRTSGYKEGTWSHYGPLADADNVSNLNSSTTEAYGPVADPLDTDILYFGTRHGGVYRYNTADGSEALFAKKTHKLLSQSNVYGVFPVSTGWDDMTFVTCPSFDADNTLWAMHNTGWISGKGTEPILYYWTAADRRSDNVAGFKALPLPSGKSFGPYYSIHFLEALKHDSNRGILLIGSYSGWGHPITLYYHGGTLDNTSDDRIFEYTDFVDQDGAAITHIYTNCFYEDPQTGYVWVGTSTGLFYFNPREALAAGENGGTLRMRRVKVSRNDGTNLADYLLDGADVYAIGADGAGRKWFGTIDNGLIVTSRDGGEIIEQFTKENSLLPSNSIYGLGFDPASNAVWIGTSGPIAVYYTDAAPAGDDYSQVLAFPNPVRPEYLGDVTIQGLMDGSLVKIVDASGGIVRELGISNGGMAIWDLTDHKGEPVRTGVYYVMSSTTGNSDSAPSKGNSTKILVVR